MGCAPRTATPTLDAALPTMAATKESTVAANEPQANENNNAVEPVATPTPDPFPNLYDCEMEITFTSGPLKSKSSNFTVLGEDYFLDKGDKFDPGKGTSIYYSDQHYFILHSSFVNGNLLRPMEAEFLRKYLEYWGSSGEAYVQGQIDSLIGSNVSWVCDGRQVFTTKIKGIVRLSHEASQQLWLQPETLEQILENHEGLASEWIGSVEPTDTPHLYAAFCGWGSESAGSARFTYFRYILQFEIIEK